MLSLRKEELKSHQDTKVYYYNCGKRIFQKIAKNKNYLKIRDHCYYTSKYRSEGHSICNLKFSVPNRIPVVFHNDLNYDHHFFIKKLASRVQGKFECLR